MTCTLTSVKSGSQYKRKRKTQELLIQEYVLRSDTTEYHNRQQEPKRTDLLPVGLQAEFRLDKDRMRVRVPGSGKEHEYQVVSEAARTDMNASGQTAQQ